MPSWWSKSSSKDEKKKPSMESFIETIFHGKFKLNSRRHCNEKISGKVYQSRAVSSSPSPLKEVSRCQSFAERVRSQPLPLPNLRPAKLGRTNSEITPSAKPRSEKRSKSSLFIPLPRPTCIPRRRDRADLDYLDRASISSETSVISDDPVESRQLSPQATDYDIGIRTAATSPSSMPKDQSCAIAQHKFYEPQKSENPVITNDSYPKSPKQRPFRGHVLPNIQIPPYGAFCSAPDSSLSSPSRSPLRAFGNDQIMGSAFWAGKTYPDANLGSGHCSSPGSGCNSGHNSMGWDMAGGTIFGQPCRSSPEYSPMISPRMTSPGPSSRVHSGAVTPLHPRAGGGSTNWPDEGKPQSHRLPLPPTSNSVAFSYSNSAATSPSIPRSPGRPENALSPGSRWKKGKLLGKGTFGYVYLGFNSGSGELCAMKEVTIFSDDAKSLESAKQMGQEIALLSRLRHPNIVQIYGCETIGDKMYIYLEYVSGGSIYKLLQDYGQFGELVIQNYTQQILLGLAYLHTKNTVHRDIKGANILVDPNGRVKLADFGVAKHITGEYCPLSFKGSPYWMAPELVNTQSPQNGCTLAVDIWSLGCTVLEMATTKPPWSQLEGAAAIFKIGNSRGLPPIPNYLSEEAKDFVRQCLQRNPVRRPNAAQLLEHPFIKDVVPLERPVLGSETLHPSYWATNSASSMCPSAGDARYVASRDSGRLATHSFRASKTGPISRRI